MMAWDVRYVVHAIPIVCMLKWCIIFIKAIALTFKMNCHRSIQVAL